MTLTIIAPASTITTAINQFNKSYHDDYFNVQELTHDYLKSPNTENIASLAKALKKVLENWGAGRRRAPKVVDIQTIESVLQNEETQTRINYFSTLSMANLNPILNAGLSEKLISALDYFSTKFLIANKGVTYPMKILLLLTGFMPALDGRVKNGLKNAGVKGFNQTQFQLPRPDIKNANYHSLVMLPCLLAHCYQEHKTLLESATQASNYPALTEHPGRLLDTLLFMQGLKEKENPDFKIFQYS